jgi:cytochrome c oxidase assembly factor CtaG
VGDDKPYLCALLSASSIVQDQQIADWIKTANSQLPDYAQIRQWLRLNDKQLLPYMTANGRLQRARLLQAFETQIDTFYQSNPMSN